MVEPKFLFGALEAFLDRPAQAGGTGEVGQRRAGAGEHQIIGTLRRITSVAADQQPAFEASFDGPGQSDPRPLVQTDPLSPSYSLPSRC